MLLELLYPDAGLNRYKNAVMQFSSLDMPLTMEKWLQCFGCSWSAKLRFPRERKGNGTQHLSLALEEEEEMQGETKIFEALVLT